MDKKQLALRFLSQEDMIECGVMDMGKCVNTMEQVFNLHRKGDTLMNSDMEHGSMLSWPANTAGKSMPESGPDKRVCAMPGYVGGAFNVAGVKWYGSNNTNPQNLGLPRSMHLIILNKSESGKPLAILDGTLVSLMRTGAMAGLGAKYLSTKDAKVAGIIGAGVINKAALLAFQEVLPELEEARVYDIKQDQSENFIEEMESKTGISIRKATNVEEAVRGADIVCVATSGKTAPEVKIAWLKKNTLVVPLGILGGEEALFNRCKLFVDTRNNFHQIVTSEPMFGFYEDLLDQGIIKKQELTEISQVMGSKKKIKCQGPRMFFSLGLPIEDVAWAYTVYQQAAKCHIGQNLKLWETPLWI